MQNIEIPSGTKVGDIPTSQLDDALELAKNSDDVIDITKVKRHTDEVIEHGDTYFIKENNAITQHFDESVDIICSVSVGRSKGPLHSIKEILIPSVHASSVPSGCKILSGIDIGGGQWVEAAENMSENSKIFQEKVTGRAWNHSYAKNGVKFDGYDDISDTLLDAKAKYSNFVDKNTGRYYDWFKGQENLIDQARRQLIAADGKPIKWYFQDKLSFDATGQLFDRRNIDGINLELF